MRSQRPPIAGAVGARPVGAAWAVAAARAVVRHPSLWVTGLRQAATLARPGWWRAWPPVPAPPDDYLRFRLQTAYGGEGPPPLPGDVVTYLRWCRQWRRLVPRSRRRPTGVGG